MKKSDSQKKAIREYYTAILTAKRALAFCAELQNEAFCDSQEYFDEECFNLMLCETRGYVLQMFCFAQTQKIKLDIEETDGNALPRNRAFPRSAVCGARSRAGALNFLSERKRFSIAAESDKQ